VDNRNSRAGSVVREVDDDWGAIFERLVLGARRGELDLSLRLDAAWFPAARSPAEMALTLLRDRAGDGPYGTDDVDRYLVWLEQGATQRATRYGDLLYPAKVSASWSTPELELTAGDFPAQLGRGVVLSLRKEDALASDTTLRGARGAARLRAGGLSIRGTVLGGTTNPLRLDPATGRFLGTTGAVQDGIATVTELGMPRAVRGPFDRAAVPTYAPDTIAAAELAGGARALELGVRGSLLARSLVARSGREVALSPGAARSAARIGTGSVSLSAPDLWGAGSANLEVAGQTLEQGRGVDAGALPRGGHGAFATIVTLAGPLTLTTELRHTRRLFPLLANVDLSRAPEASALQWSSAPTTEAFWVDTEFENFATCVSGGRARADVALARGRSVFAWVGRHETWAESVANERCRTDPSNGNSVWDLATGFELGFAGGRGRGTFTVGTRSDQAGRPLATADGSGTTRVFYQEAYVRHDLHVPLGGAVALELSGWDRHRVQTLGGPGAPWVELLHTVGVNVGERWTVAATADGTTDPRVPPTYFGLSGTFRRGAALAATLTAGQRRGGQRCVSGVCRMEPPFEGVRADLSLRY